MKLKNMFKKDKISEEDFKRAILVVALYLAQNNGKKCEVEDEIINDLKFSCKIQITKFENIKTKEKIV